MTDNEIIRALRCCLAKENCEVISCEKCPLERICECKETMFIETIDLINRQKAEIDILIRKKESLRDEIAEQQAEIERLTNKCEDCAGCSEWKCDCANERAYAIEKFWEKVRAFAVVMGCFHIVEHGDNLVKEMTSQL